MQISGRTPSSLSNTLKVLGFSLAVSLGLSACNSNNNNVNVTPTPPAETPKTKLRVIHGSADAPKVNVLANGAVITGLSDVDYTVGSGFITLDAATYAVTVDGILPDASTTQVLNLGNVALAENTQYTVVAHGVVAEDGNPNNDLAAAVISNTESAVGDGNIRLQVLHAAPNAPAVDLHVTGATDALGTPLGTLAYGDNTAQVEVPAGVYRVRLVLPEGSDAAGTVAYDVVLPELAAGADMFVAAVPMTGVTTSPVKLLVNDGTSTTTLIDDRTTANVRVIHAAADVPNVAIFVDDNLVAPLNDVPFLAVSDYVALPGGAYTVDTRLAANTDVTGISGTLNVEKNMRYTVNAVGTLDATDNVALEYYVLDDSVRRVATESKVRLTHVHPSVGNVDIYVTNDGNIDNVAPTFANVAYKASTGFVTLAPGEYSVKITAEGTKTVAIDTGMLMLAGGGIYSATAVNAPNATPLANLILSDDF